MTFYISFLLAQGYQSQMNQSKIKLLILIQNKMDSLQKTSLCVAAHILRRYSDTFMKTEPENNGKLPLAEEFTVRVNWER
jgi:hypothetical protein